MNKRLSILAVFMAMFLPLWADTEQIDVGNIGYDVDFDEPEYGAYVCGADLSGSGDLVIPDEIEYNTGGQIIKFRVYGISSFAFEHNEKLTSITINDGANKICPYAFHDCQNLKSVRMGTNITDIQTYAFANCPNLSSFQFPAHLMFIGEYAFEKCTALTAISLPNNVEAIEQNAFQDCTGIESITIEEGGRYFDSRENCNAIIKKATNTLYIGCKNTIIPSTVKAIGNYAFHNCTGLSTLFIPKAVESIGEYAFEMCTGLSSIAVEEGNTHFDSRNDCDAIIETASNTLVLGCKNTIIPNTVKTLGDYSFGNCTGLKSIAIPSSVTTIETSVFSGCTELKNITIPESVTGIGTGTFRNCKNLLSLTIPEEVTRIESYLFYGCIKLESVNLGSKITYIGAQAFRNSKIGILTCLAPEPPSVETTTFLDADIGELRVLEASVDKYQKDSNWGKRISRIRPKSIAVYYSATTDIGNRFSAAAFNGPTSDAVINSLGDGNYEAIFDNNILSVKVFAFEDCTELTSITLPASVVEIQMRAFFGCTNLKTVKFGNKLTRIGEYAFANCTSLTEVNLPDWTDKIEDYAFYGCKAMTTLNLGSHIRTIGKYAFQECSSIEELEIPNTVTSLGEEAFYKCSGLKSVTIGRSVTSIASSAFSSCFNMTTLTLPHTLKSIGATAFSSCTKLTSLYIPQAVESISNDAFNGCGALTSIVVEEGNTTYDSHGNCNALIETASHKLLRGCKNTTIPKDVTTIGSQAFSNCSELTSFTIPNTVTSIGNGAFRGCTSLETVTIGSGIRSIELNAFNGCSSLTTITHKSYPKYEQYVFKGINTKAKHVLNLNDAEHPFIYVGTNKQAPKFSTSSSYKRSCSNKIQALYVPFKLSVTKDLADLEVYELTGEKEGAITATLLTKDSTATNTPYLIRAKSSSASISKSSLTISPEDSSQEVGPFAVVGTYHDINYGEIEGDWYALKDGKFMKAGSGALLYPMRFYLKGLTPSSVKGDIDICFEESTGINDILSRETTADGMYNLQGQKVSANYKGIVVVNGKKMMKQ